MYCEEPMFGYDGSELNVVKPLVSSPFSPLEQATPRSDLDALSYVWSNVTLSVLDVGEARAAGAESAAARRARVKALNCMIQVRKMNREKDGWRKKDQSAKCRYDEVEE